MFLQKKLLVLFIKKIQITAEILHNLEYLVSVVSLIKILTVFLIQSGTV